MLVIDTRKAFEVSTGTFAGAVDRILKYLEEIDQEESLWEGECFVFDQRVSVTHGVHPGTHAIYVACGYPVSPEEMRSSLYQPGLSCPSCHDLLTATQQQRNRERVRQRQQINANKLSSLS